MPVQKRAGRNPEWLHKLWKRKRRETAKRVAAAVSRLVAKGKPVTIETIRSTVKALSGVSISANTIYRNEAAYGAYQKHHTEPQRRATRETSLSQLLRDAPTNQRTSLRAKINRLRRESKDALIAKLIRLEDAAQQHNARENNLREEILRLTLDAGTRRSK
jgi:hypothetical protein